MFDRSEDRCLWSAFRRHARVQPDAPAIFVQGRVITYAELDARAETLAWAMLERLGRRPERVGIFAYRSEATYTGILGSLYAGATYVPLNRRFPVERTRTMVGKAALDAIVVDKASATQLDAVLDRERATPLVLTEEQDADLTAVPPRRRVTGDELRQTRRLTELPPTLPDDVAYLLFTSGTTGEPKGVMVSHGNVLHLLDRLRDDLAYTAQDRSTQHFDHTFDVSVFDLFATWDAGGCVYVPQATDLLAPAVFANAHGLTVWFSVPSLVAQMRRAGQLRAGTLPHLRLSMFAGEAMPRPLMEAWQLAAPNARVINMYGPTETTIVCSGYPWKQGRSVPDCVHDLVPIGRMFPGVGALVVDEDLNPVPFGESGELCVSGPLTCPGYWRDSERTAERFVELPISAVESRRFYRTGDRVRRLPNGHYVFLGRVDFQIKVRGYRIELAEIEAVLLRQPGVVASAAIGWPLEGGRPEGIVAFATGFDLQDHALLDALRACLPPYMVPAQVVLLESLPLNTNGKTDRAALQAYMADRA